MTVQANQMAERSWRVPADQHQSRLDVFLRQCLPHLSRRQLETAIQDGVFKLRNRVAKKGDRLSAGEELHFRGGAEWLTDSPAPSERPLPVLFEDESILAVNKPAGIATHGFSRRETDALANRLLAPWPDLATIGASRWEPGIIHRLDRETSGVVLIAKSREAFEHVRSQFRRRKVKKIYWALVRGKTLTRGSIELSLAHDPKDRSRMLPINSLRRSSERAWEAKTRFRLLAQSDQVSFLEVEMATGVTHQIRAHLSAVGHPLVGDRLYGDAGAGFFGLRRHFLHARSVTINHPKTGKPLTIVAELPGELAEALERLKIGI